MLCLWLSQQPLIWMESVQTHYTLPQLLKISPLHSWTPLVPQGQKGWKTNFPGCLALAFTRVLQLIATRWQNCPIHYICSFSFSSSVEFSSAKPRMGSLELDHDTTAPGIWLRSDRDVLQTVTKRASWIIHTEQAQRLWIHHPAAVSALPQRAGLCHGIIWGAYLPSHTGGGGQPRGLQPFTADAEAFLDHPAPESLFTVDSGFRTLKVVVSDVLGRCITHWQIFHGMAYNIMHFSAGSFIFCFILCKTKCTHHLTKELSLKETATVNKCAERRCELVFCPQDTGLWLCSCPPSSLMCGLGRATYTSYALLHL